MSLPITAFVTMVTPIRLSSIDLACHDRFRQPELGDAVDQDAARLMESLIDRDAMAKLGKVVGAGQARRAAADDGDLLARLRPRYPAAFRRRSCAPSPRANRSSRADADRLMFLGQGAEFFALALLRADPAADGRQQVRLLDDRRLRGRSRSSCTALMKRGIGTPTGQPVTQGGFLHCMQREASRTACSGVYPRRDFFEIRPPDRRGPARGWGSSSGLIFLGVFASMVP